MADNLNQILATVDGRPTVAAYCAGSRQIAALPADLVPVRVSLLASFTIDPLIPFLNVEAARHGLRTEVHQARFNTARQELLDSHSESVRQAPDVVFVAELLQDVCPELSAHWTAPAPDEVTALIEAAVTELESALIVFRRSSQAAIVVHNFAQPRRAVMGVADAMSESSQIEAVNRLNYRLGVVLPRIPGVHVLDAAGAAARIGLTAWYDDRMWLLARTPLSTAAMIELARTQATFLKLLRTPQRKCLALDLDRTLWGGVVGDAGVDGIELGPEYPGNAFMHFQQFLLGLHRRGVLLALLSKNNQADVDEVFDRHPSMLLRREHFAATRINWRPKADNLAAIADELSIGTDAFVFFDDDAAECAWMREARPEVLTIQAPSDLTAFSEALVRSAAFERLSITREDRQRGAMYAAGTARREASAAATSVDDFLKTLDMQAVVQPVGDSELPRVIDLISKTNQFNVTTRRHSAAAVAAMTASGDHAAFALRLRDRFGDNGLVGVAIVRRQAREAVIDSLLLSCRVIGRQAETALLSVLAGWARAHGVETLVGEFIPTAKNAPAADCYERHGFDPLPPAGPIARWGLPVQARSVSWPSCIAIATGAPA